MFSRESTDFSSDKSAVQQARINISEFCNSFTAHHKAESMSVCKALTTSTAAVTANDDVVVDEQNLIVVHIFSVFLNSSHKCHLISNQCSHCNR